MFPTKTLLFIILFILPPPLKPWFLRYCCGAQVGRHVRIGWFTSLMGRQITLEDYSEIRALTLIRCDGAISLGRYGLISSFNLVYGAAGLHVGEHSYIGPQSLINTEEDVRIGRWSALGARSMIYTHGSFLPFTEGYWVRFAPVTVGDYVWCAAGVFLQPGAEIGDNSFVNSRSVVSGSLPAGSIAEGNPAQIVGQMERMRRTMSPRRLDAAAAQMLRHFADLVLKQSWGVQVEQQGGNLRMHYRGQTYRIMLAPSHGDAPTIPNDATRTIWLISRPAWRPANSSHWLDLTRNEMISDPDPVYQELALFLKRYYGVQLEFVG
ncbi:acyltransferase [Candidatus Viridilinea mediisalina]|uniref:Transferase n=1 Tax=Candidatus Viridilinea mediisalina TaxID=2024553 RepID=A0A2A6RMT3_9CHLR|nr:acyltransferase [Candidatus Viridilinea mediisalina]PDW04372.1 transferase [Candidatus Viridilinea mediisalina]